MTDAPSCGANRADPAGPPVCAFAPTHLVRFELPPGHRYGYPDHHADMATHTCAVHLETILETIRAMGAEPRAELLPRPLQ